MSPITTATIKSWTTNKNVMPYISKLTKEDMNADAVSASSLMPVLGMKLNELCVKLKTRSVLAMHVERMR